MEADRITLTTRLAGSCTVVTAVGDIDLATAPQLRACLSAAIDADAQALVIDVTGVGFLDSTGIGVLIGAWNRLGSRPDAITLVGASPLVRRVLQLTAIDRIFTLRDRLPEAVGVVTKPELAP